MLADNIRHSALFRRIRRSVARYPTPYFAIAKATGNQQLLNQRTDLVIEGFPRCGNSFTEAAFQWSQNPGFELASHCHAPAHAIRAVKRGIPVLILIRDPDDAVASYLDMKNDPNALDAAFQDYIGFYRPLIAFEKRLYPVEFDQILKQFDDVVRRLNSQFGTDFAVPEWTPESIEMVNKLRDQLSEQRIGRAPIYSRVNDPERLSRRNAHRQEMSQHVQTSSSRYRDEARAVYHQWLNLTETS